MLYEFCADGTSNIKSALAAGAGRVELCCNLAEGGLAPDEAAIKRAKALCDKAGAALMCMVRPRPGNFEYSDAELGLMYTQATRALKHGASGLVLGMACPDMLAKNPARLESSAQTAAQTFDAERLQALLQRIREYALSAGYRSPSTKLDITYHMAFDTLAPDNQLCLLRVAQTFGITRVLTHGGPLETPIEQNFDHLRQLVNVVQQENLNVKILPGGGITWENAALVAEVLGVDELHGTRIVPLAKHLSRSVLMV